MSFLWVNVDKKNWALLQLKLFLKLVQNDWIKSVCRYGNTILKPVWYTPNKRGRKQMSCTSYENTKFIYDCNDIMKIDFIRRYIYTNYKYNFWTTKLIALGNWLQSSMLKILVLSWLEDTARYAGLLLARPQELEVGPRRPRLFFGPKKLWLCCFGTVWVLSILGFQ